MEFRYYFLLLLMLPLSLRAQTVDSSRTSRALHPDPSATSTKRKPSLAQPLTNQEMTQIVNSVGGGSHPGVMLRTIDNRYEGIQGSPYFLNQWVKGRIDMVTGANYESVPLKYDAFSQNLVLRRDAMRDSIVVFPNQVKQFLLRTDDGAEWVFRRYPNVKISDNNLKDGYFLVLYDGKTSLLKRVSKVFKKADYKDPYSTNVRYDAYNSDFAYFILKPDNTLVKIKKSKKSLYEALNDKGANFDTFAQQEKLNFKTDTDYAKIVTYYDGL